MSGHEHCDIKRCRGISALSLMGLPLCDACWTLYCENKKFRDAVRSGEVTRHVLPKSFKFTNTVGVVAELPKYAVKQRYGVLKNVE